MPDLLFTKAPHWEWLAVLYFFLGGLAGGSYALAAIAELFGGGRYRSAATAGFLVAFPAILVGGSILVIDLRHPERFWHMIFMSERAPTPILKWWSPMSVGAWFLLLFGVVSFFTFLASLQKEGRPRLPPFARLRDDLFGKVLIAIGGFLGLCVAGYTGVLLAVTNRPVWSETPWIGALFTISAISTATALLTLLLRRRDRDPTRSQRDALARYARWVVVIEAVVLVAFAVTLGGAIRAWSGAIALTLLLGVVALAILVPIAGWVMRREVRFEAWGAAAVLLGGFLLRALIVLPVEAL
jgi:formate-dependent nitrite reductase membrane component NrfD